MNKKNLSIYLVVLSILISGCSTTKPTYNHWNMASSPKADTKENKTIISQNIDIEISDYASRYFSHRDIESSITISLINHGIYSLSDDGYKNLFLGVENFNIDTQYTSLPPNEISVRSGQEKEMITIEIDIRYILKSNNESEINYERVFKTKHSEYVKITKRNISDIIEEAIQNNYTSFIENIRKFYL